jgi:hypothetical protein
MITVYLDWNVFNKLEKVSELDESEKYVFVKLGELISNGTILCPYSNAHISDLHRGYLKNPNFIKGHITTLERFTGKLCLVQYWGAKEVKWHYRSPGEFLQSTIDESSQTGESFSSLQKMEGEPVLNSLVDLRNSTMKQIKIPDSFTKIYEVDPFFSYMYPRTKIEMNQLALCEDLFAFSHRIKSDYVFYKNYRKLLSQFKAKYPQIRQTIIKAESTLTAQPKHISWDDQWDEIDLGYKSSNPTFDKIFDLFTKTDLKGYRQDERFANLIDDALHTFYGAHCDYFITLDSRCFDKAVKIYQKLNIQTKVQPRLNSSADL